MRCLVHSVVCDLAVQTLPASRPELPGQICLFTPGFSNPLFPLREPCTFASNPETGYMFAACLTHPACMVGVQ